MIKITLFTADQRRHNYLINLLSKIDCNLFVVQEKKKSSKNLNIKSKLIKKYFSKVEIAEKKVFKKTKMINNIKLFKASRGLNNYNLKDLSQFLKSDLYIVYGSSLIKSKLIKFLIKKKAINIHLGIAPQYRGRDCNFWALYDDKPELVGATIHLISDKVDKGNLLYHAVTKNMQNPYFYSMSAAKSAFKSLKDKIIDRSIFKIKPRKQSKINQIRLTKSDDFNEIIVKKFMNKKFKRKKIKFNKKKYKDLFILQK